MTKRPKTPKPKRPSSGTELPPVGARIWVYWFAELRWFEGVVTATDPATADRKVEYFVDGDVRWHDLSRMTWEFSEGLETARKGRGKARRSGGGGKRTDGGVTDGGVTKKRKSSSAVRGARAATEMSNGADKKAARPRGEAVREAAGARRVEDVGEVEEA
eukprot:CAMPEP_0198358650 /NCGR_PEP_ID=MMETSP1450-20131203/131648_1 /TAXON_ID=753684 ORGANISM="Madagascaria erythrocladiodes, Strain CCMP3234" /NCGR_SAMPLE_ID=MMETSP1450 /ASSEMBLY_ACC=CAM_ASM_001115 /LENGTH=159 /DNA_ID=CAMNT_0044065421 /DNA_START=41 /DNA_END=516 /DNA_ORIENTATION=+